jgi:hypothetical protein
MKTRFVVVLAIFFAVLLLGAAGYREPVTILTDTEEPVQYQVSIVFLNKSSHTVVIDLDGYGKFTLTRSNGITIPAEQTASNNFTYTPYNLVDYYHDNGRTIFVDR